VRRPFWPVLVGAVIGVLIELPALYAAIVSGGAGHGQYVAARALFPVPMVMTYYEGDRIGLLSISLALVQFPFYGGLIGWALARKAYVAIVAVVAIHLVATSLCFSGAVPNFS
jgi:hypothetical protein